MIIVDLDKENYLFATEEEAKAALALANKEWTKEETIPLPTPIILRSEDGRWGIEAEEEAVAVSRDGHWNTIVI